MNKDDRYRRDVDRNDRFHEDRRRRRGDSFHRDQDDGRHRDGNRERSDSGYYSDDYDDSHRNSRDYDRFHRDDDSRRSSFDSRDHHRRRRSRDFSSDRDDNDDNDNYENGDNRKKQRDEINKKRKKTKEPKEWPPSFQKDESAYTFDTRSAMFYEPLSDFFYDPKSKLYYGNKKCAYFKYDETNDSPKFVQVQKMTAEQVEEQQRGEQENVHAAIVPAADIVSTPKIAIKFKTKKVKSSASTLASQKCDNPQQQQPATVSKVKQQQIANIGKWNEKQAELKDKNHTGATATKVSDPPPPQVPQKVRTTVKGEPICMICKKKFPNLAKLRLHEKASELHKKNLKLLQEKRKAKLAASGGGGAKRKLDDSTTKETPMYTDRAEKRRQLHGTDLRAPVPQAMLQLPQANSPIPASEPTAPGADLLDENNMGHKMLLKMGYRAKDPQQQQDKPKSANEHLRKEWDRIEAMAQKSVPRNR